MINFQDLALIVQNEDDTFALKFDSQYSCPDWNWILGEFSTYFRQWLINEGLADINGNPLWVDNKNDCDKFAWHAVSRMKLIQAKGKDAPNTGMAFGMCQYVPDNIPPNGKLGDPGVVANTGREGHCINVAVVKIDGNYHLRFWEPQLQREAKLSPTELKSIDSDGGLQI